MKKLLIFFSAVLLLVGCSTKIDTPTNTSTTPPTKNPSPSSDATTAATQYDGVTSATVDLNGLDYAVSLNTDDVEKIVLEKEPNAIITKYELDDENNRIVYDVEIYLNNNKYDIKIDANTGDIISWKIDD